MPPKLAVENIPPMDVLVTLGRGPDDYERAQLAADIAEAAAVRQEFDAQRDRSAEFLGPLVFLCGNEPWHRTTAEPASADEQIEAMGMRGHIYDLLRQVPGSHPHLVEYQFRTVGGNSTIASMVQVAESPEVAANPEWSITF